MRRRRGEPLIHVAPRWHCAYHGEAEARPVTSINNILCSINARRKSPYMSSCSIRMANGDLGNTRGGGGNSASAAAIIKYLMEAFTSLWNARGNVTSERGPMKYSSFEMKYYQTNIKMKNIEEAAISGESIEEKKARRQRYVLTSAEAIDIMYSLKASIFLLMCHRLPAIERHPPAAGRPIVTKKAFVNLIT